MKRVIYRDKEFFYRIAERHIPNAEVVLLVLYIYVKRKGWFSKLLKFKLLDYFTIHRYRTFDSGLKTKKMDESFVDSSLKEALYQCIRQVGEPFLVNCSPEIEAVYKSEHKQVLTK